MFAIDIPNHHVIKEAITEISEIEKEIWLITTHLSGLKRELINSLNRYLQQFENAQFITFVNNHVVLLFPN